MPIHLPQPQICEKKKARNAGTRSVAMVKILWPHHARQRRDNHNGTPLMPGPYRGHVVSVKELLQPMGPT